MEKPEEWWKPYVDAFKKRQKEIYDQLNEKGIDWAIDEGAKAYHMIGTAMLIKACYLPEKNETPNDDKAA